jgi:hypothetical protein
MISTLECMSTLRGRLNPSTRQGGMIDELKNRHGRHELLAKIFFTVTALHRESLDTFITPVTLRR